MISIFYRLKEILDIIFLCIAVKFCILYLLELLFNHL